MHFSSQYIFASLPRATSAPKRRHRSLLGIFTGQSKCSDKQDLPADSSELLETDGCDDRVAEPCQPACTETAKQVSVPLRQVMPALVNAANQNSAWIQDFDEEQITISEDLHEVIQQIYRMQQRLQPATYC